MRKFSKRKIAATIAITAILVGGGGAAAIAYWTSGGSGTGSAATGTSVSIIANQTSVVTNLVPGGAAQTLSGNFINNSGQSVFVNKVTATIGTITQATGATGTCSASDYSLVGGVMNVGTSGTLIATGTSGAWGGATLQFANSTTANQDGCKGATVAINYAIS